MTKAAKDNDPKLLFFSLIYTYHIYMKKFITENSKETKKLGAEFACNFQDGEIVCLSGDLGSGKTTFAQGMLEALSAEGPYTSPTFVIMKEYKPSISPASPDPAKRDNFQFPISNIYHIDAYRISRDDIINLGWEEIIENKNNVVIVEWAERIKEVIPKRAVWIKFQWLNENRREIVMKAKSLKRKV